MSRLGATQAALDAIPRLSYACGMKVHLAPEDETVARMLERRAQFIEGVSWGIAAADRGDLIDHDEVANPHRAAFQL
jgi:hypothetical protein